MDLIKIDMIRLKPFQRFFAGKTNVGRRKILWNFALTLPFAGIMVKIITKLGGNRNLAAPSAKGFSQYRLTAAIAVCVGRIIKNDAKIKSFLKEPDSIVIIDFAPPTRR